MEKSQPGEQETLVQFQGGEDCWRRDRLPTPVFSGFPPGSADESACNAGDMVQSLDWEDPLEEGKTTLFPQKWCFCVSSNYLRFYMHHVKREALKGAIFLYLKITTDKNNHIKFSVYRQRPRNISTSEHVLCTCGGCHSPSQPQLHSCLPGGNH